MYRRLWKRVIDTILAAGGIVVFAIPMLIIGICIKADSKGPIIIKQSRLGKNKKPFKVMKFRTMCDHAYEKGGIAKKSDDPRITKVGAFLRRTSLDELPQFFNIVSGQMAIIGPRPILDWEFDEYSSNKRYLRRYDALPGMFCTVDLDYRAQADRDLQFSMDADYVDNMSFKLDFKVFFGIIKTVISGKNVYVEEQKDEQQV